jgi:hypothetical protein
MRMIVSIKFGSHLYGTSTPASDVDFKSVYIPAADDILLQRVKGSINTARRKAEKEKNLPGEVEEEAYSLQRYLGLVAEGQTVALDMFFAPEWSMTAPPAPEWREIVENRHRLLTRRSAAFVGYCRQQANKYGIKGSRVAAARAVLALLDRLVVENGTTAKLGSFEAEIIAAVEPIEHTSFLDIPAPGDKLVRHLEVCNRKLPFTASIKSARDIIQRLVDEYGQRALLAESQQGVDWKALSHAVRVGRQAVEFLQTGHVTFPLPYAEHILAIKLGGVEYQAVAAEIEDLLFRVEDEAARSPLPDAPDFAWIDDFVADVYRREVRAPYSALADRARLFATAAHGAVKQVRKYTGEAYITHPASVAAIVSSVPHTEEMLAAAWLHDVVEDTDVGLFQIEMEFGPAVARLVYWLTDRSRPEDGNRATRKALDRSHSAAAPPEAQTIKLADIIDNTETIEEHDPDFARVFRHEKERLLAVMDKGDPTLMARARAQIGLVES